MSIIITGPYTAYLAHLAARAAYTRACKADAKAFQAFRETYPERAPAGRQPCDETHAAAVKACGRMLVASSDLDLERELASEDWEPCTY